MQKGQGKIGRESALERVILIWGIPSELHSNRGTYFADLIVKEICKIWWMMQHFHCDYNSQFSGLMERTNRTIKTHLAKITCAYSFPWSTILPLLHKPCYLTPCTLLDGEGNGTPLQYSCLENPMDGGAW